MNKKIYSLLILFFSLTSAVFSQESDSNYYGWLSFQANVDTFLVVVDQNYSDPYSIEGDSMKIESGKHSLILVHPEYEDVRSRINIEPNGKHGLATTFRNKIEEDSTLSSYKRITEGLPHNITIITDENSSIVIDDSTYGKGYIQTDIGPYTHYVKVIHPTARNRTEEIYINPSGQERLILYTRPKRSISLLLGIVPTASQWYKNQKIKGVVLTATTLGASIFSFFKFKNYNDLNNEYTYMLNEYQGINDELEALEFGNLVEQKFEEVNKAARIRDVTLVAVLGLYAYNIFDAIFSKPQSGYQVNIKPSNISFLGSQTEGIKFQVNF